MSDGEVLCSVVVEFWWGREFAVSDVGDSDDPANVLLDTGKMVVYFSATVPSRSGQSTL